MTSRSTFIAASFFSFGVIGWALGFAAWGPNRAPAIAAILPILIGLAGSRVNAFSLATCYLWAVERATPELAASWFSESLAVTTLMVMGYGALGGVFWSLGWTSSRNPARKSLVALFAWAVTLLPPAALIPGHTVVAWGFILPNSGWIGVALSAFVPAALLWCSVRFNLTFWQQSVAVALLILALLVPTVSYIRLPDQSFENVIAISTAWGGSKESLETVRRMERMGEVTKAVSPGSVVVFPESIIPRLDSSALPVLNFEILDRAAATGITVVIGADLKLSNGNLESAAVAFAPDGGLTKAVARQVIPLATWKPWQSTGSVEVNWRSNNVLVFPNGLKARVVFCYEEKIPILSLMNEAFDDHQIVIVMANLWSARTPLASEIQSRHSEGIARMFGRPLVRALNQHEAL